MKDNLRYTTNTGALLSIQVRDLLHNFYKSFLGGAGGSGSSTMAVGGLGALAGALLGGGGDAAKGAIGGGVMALLGSLAVSAIKNMNRPANVNDTNSMPQTI